VELVMARIVCIGEGMLELSRPAGDWQLAYGGDTLNTAIHLARAGHNVAFFSALGTDPLSRGAKEAWRAEGLDTSLVLDHPARHIGLYAVATESDGERSFTYWRDESAAREMFALPGGETALSAAAEADLLVFSLVSLAILPPGGRARLLRLASAVRARSGRVAFDGNYRPPLWRGEGDPVFAREAAIACADIGLPTLDDETALTGEVDPGAIAARWAELGCLETVVKLGAAGCWIPSGEIVAPKHVLQPVDTSGAGDAFNAGYLAARLRGAGIAEAASAGNALASRTIMYPGAVPPREKCR
jgi:2-dehydro-3-deoxygluconokinase